MNATDLRTFTMFTLEFKRSGIVEPLRLDLPNEERVMAKFEALKDDRDLVWAKVTCQDITWDFAVPASKRRPVAKGEAKVVAEFTA